MVYKKRWLQPLTYNIANTAYYCDTNLNWLTYPLSLMFKDLLTKFRKNKVPSNLVPELMQADNRLPVSFVRGEGTLLWDIDGNQYLDAFASDGSVMLGHSHAQISQVISLQAAQLLHSSAKFHNKEQADLATVLCEISGMDKVVFGQTLAEATSAALALTCAQARQKNIKAPIVLSTNSALLGNQTLTQSASKKLGNSTRSKFAISGLETIKINNIDDVGKHSSKANVVAVFVETVASDGSVLLAEAEYLRAVRELCNEHDWLLILDESRTCMGRTGDWFSYQNADVLPDIVVAADTLANGLALAVCAARGEVCKLLESGDHESVYGGNQLASRCGLTLIEILREEKLLVAAQENGEYLKRQLQHRIGTLNAVKAVYSQGLFITIELDRCYADLAATFLLQSLVVGVNQKENTIYLVPAVNLSQDQALNIARTVCAVLEAI